MPALNNVTTADRYTAATTLVAPKSSRLLVHARNAAIYYQLGRGLPATLWDDEVFLPPGTLGAVREFDTARFRSAVAGTPAQITVEGIGD